MKEIHNEQIEGYEVSIWEDIKTSTSYDVVLINQQKQYKAYTLPTKEMAFEKIKELKATIDVGATNVRRQPYVF